MTASPPARVCLGSDVDLSPVVERRDAGHEVWLAGHKDALHAASRRGCRT
jgi:hypothetical protein